MHFTGLSDATLATVQAILASCHALETALVYGSRAKGNFKTGSDIDLSLFGKQLSQHLLNDIAEALEELLLPYTIDLCIFDQLNHPELREHIQRVGVVFYRKPDNRKQE